MFIPYFNVFGFIDEFLSLAKDEIEMDENHGSLDNGHFIWQGLY